MVLHLTTCGGTLRRLIRAQVSRSLYLIWRRKVDSLQVIPVPPDNTTSEKALVAEQKMIRYETPGG